MNPELVSEFAAVINRHRGLMCRAIAAENFDAANRHKQRAAQLYSECLAIFASKVPGFDRPSFDLACGLGKSAPQRLSGE